MNKLSKFSRQQSLPTVFARIVGKEKTIRLRLVFDTGAAKTQFSTSVIEDLGYSAADGVEIISAYGTSGPSQEGYSVYVQELKLLGKTFSKPLIAVYDFENLSNARLDGLLGFDLIKEFHLEMNGPGGELVVFN